MPKPKPTKTTRHAIDYQLDDVDRRILALKLKHPSMKKVHIAELIGLERKQIATRMKKPAWLDAYSDNVMPAKALLKKKEDQLTRKYVQLTESQNEHIKEKVISKILVTQGILKSENTSINNVFEPIVINVPLYNQQIKIDVKDKQIQGEVVDPCEQNSP